MGVDPGRQRRRPCRARNGEICTAVRMPGVADRRPTLPRRVRRSLPSQMESLRNLYRSDTAWRTSLLPDGHGCGRSGIMPAHGKVGLSTGQSRSSRRQVQRGYIKLSDKYPQSGRTGQRSVSPPEIFSGYVSQRTWLRVILYGDGSAPLREALKGGCEAVSHAFVRCICSVRVINDVAAARRNRRLLLMRGSNGYLVRTDRICSIPLQGLRREAFFDEAHLRRRRPEVDRKSVV